ncbi:MAG: class I SAM-dependent methyltransferase [Coriobacteriia bacterium]|nr:class I SAM-dependent methyltransferase [Coriobacteriia bacterium]
MPEDPGTETAIADVAQKASAAEIRERFDAAVERFSDLTTGQETIVDAPLILDLVSACAKAVTPDARRILDVGSGAGNYALKLLEQLPDRDVVLLDLSARMLERARERVSAHTSGSVECVQGDMREVGLGDEGFDIVVAAASLHHLRGEDEWRDVFGRIYRTLRPGGSFWIADIIAHEDPRIQGLFWERYGEYLAQVLGTDRRDRMFADIALNDTPRPIGFQVKLLYESGFARVDIVHKSSLFAVLGAIR